MMHHEPVVESLTCSTQQQLLHMIVELIMLQVLNTKSPLDLLDYSTDYHFCTPYIYELKENNRMASNLDLR